MTQSRIEPATCGFVAQYFNHYATACPHYYYFYYITLAFADLFDNDFNESESGGNKWALAAY